MKRAWHYFYIYLILIFFLTGFTDVSIKDIEGSVLKGNYEEAQRLAQDFWTRTPQGAEVFQARYYFALSSIYLKQYSLAIKSLKENIQLPTEPQWRDKAYLALIDAYYLNADYDLALKTAKKLLKSSKGTPYLSLIYLKMAKTDLKLAQWREARSYLNKILAEFPDSMEVNIAKQLLEEKQYFAVQVGSFMDRGHAETLLNELKQKGEYAYIVETIDDQSRKFFRVRVGQLALLNQAQELKTKLADQGYPTQIFP